MDRLSLFQNTITKVNLLNKVLGIVAGVLLIDHDVRHTGFQQASSSPPSGECLKMLLEGKHLFFLFLCRQVVARQAATCAQQIMFLWELFSFSLFFVQVPYHRIFIMLFLELSSPDPILENISFPVLTAYCNMLHILRPAKATGFAFAWLVFYANFLHEQH
jgi:hypothetical protein